MCSCLRGVSRWFTPLACGPGYPELSKSYMDMASKLFTLHYITHQGGGLPPWLVVPVLRSCQSPIWIWLVNYLHLHLHQAMCAMFAESYA